MTLSLCCCPPPLYGGGGIGPTELWDLEDGGRSRASENREKCQEVLFMIEKKKTLCGNMSGVCRVIMLLR